MSKFYPLTITIIVCFGVSAQDNSSKEVIHEQVKHEIHERAKSEINKRFLDQITQLYVSNELKLAMSAGEFFGSNDNAYTTFLQDVLDNNISESFRSIIYSRLLNGSKMNPAELDLKVVALEAMLEYDAKHTKEPFYLMSKERFNSVFEGEFAESFIQKTKTLKVVDPTSIEEVGPSKNEDKAYEMLLEKYDSFKNLIVLVGPSP